MSFRDEINSVLKTPMQVNEEKKQESIKRGKILAKVDYESLKKAFYKEQNKASIFKKKGEIF